MNRCFALFFQLAATLGVADTAASESIKMEPNLEAVRAAADPEKAPPLADPIFPASHAFSELGPPGPWFPERAARYGLGGVAVIQCVSANAGALTDCTIQAEGPLDFGFGFAAIKMAKIKYLKATPPAGVAEGGIVRVIVVFPKPQKF